MSVELRIQASTKAIRHEIITAAKEAIIQSGGAILDFQMFSNLFIALLFEIPPRQVNQLYASLCQINLCLSEEAKILLEQFAPIDAQSERNLAASLQITFVHAEPDLRITIPPIPG